MVWRNRVASVDVLHKCNQHVVINIIEANGSPWLLSGVYASTDYKERQVLWSEVARLIKQGVLSLVVDCGGYVL